MAKKVSENEILNMSLDWAYDMSNGLPYSGAAVQKFIKDKFNTKAGIFYNDTTNNRYLVFADEDIRDTYLADPTQTGLILGSFDAPSNYTAVISMTTPNFNAVLYGATGNYIEFTFDTFNKNDESVGEDVTCTYTIIRGGSKKVVTERYRYGTQVKFSVDKYLEEGTNTVTVGVVGNNTLAGTSVGVTYQVVNLKVSSSYDISKVYNLNVNPNAVAEIPYSVSGTGTKTMEWYLDGSLLPFELTDEVVEVAATKTKYISLSGLQQGTHSVQFRAYVTVNGEKFYSDVVYMSVMVYTLADRNPLIAVAVTNPSDKGIATSGLTIYGVEQYSPYTFRMAVYDPQGAAVTETSVFTGNYLQGTVSVANGTPADYTVRLSGAGATTLRIEAGVSSFVANMEVEKSSANISEIASNLLLNLSATGRSNMENNKDQWVYGDYSTIFKGFQWNSTSGWNSNRLLVSDGASIEVNLAPFADRGIAASGLTIEMEFSTLNVNNENAVLCDLRNVSGKGLLLTASEATITSAGDALVTTKYKSGEDIRLSFVVNPATGATNKGLAFIYINGILSGASKFAENDNFLSDALLKMGGTTEAAIALKQILIYNRALSDDEILNNYTFYRDTNAEMMDVYDRNNIMDGRQVDLNALAAQCPVLKITGDIPTLENTTDKDETIYVDVEYTNMQNPSYSFTGTYLRMKPQGTSSMGYPKKNFRLYTTKHQDSRIYDSEGKEILDRLYSFKPGAQPVDCWCFKADYAESSGTHNTGIARIWGKVMYDAQIDGEYKLRTNAQKIAAANGYPYDVRTTIDGFPCHLVYRLDETSEWIYIGKYNFNNDKSTESVFGFTGIDGFDNSRMQCWEVLNNGNHLALFEDVENFDTEWAEAYESRYPDVGAAANTADLKAFCEWVVSTKGNVEKFSTEKWQHMDVYKAAAYYVYVMRFGAVDQTVKNSMLTSEDGQLFYWINYDNDTINGLRNDGLLVFGYTIDRQSLDPSYTEPVYVYAGHSSTLWNNMEADAEFMTIVAKVDDALYTAGLKYSEVIKMFDQEQSAKWSERVYNLDAQYKYVGPYNDKGTNNLFMLQGARRSHRRWWLSHRFDLMDSMFVSGKYKANIVDFKVMNDTPAGQQFTIQSGSLLYYGYGVNDIPAETGVKLESGEEKTFTTKQVLNIGDPVRIYSAQNLQKVDLSPLMSRLTQLGITGVYDEVNGSMLKKLILGNGTSVNIGLSEISGLDMAKSLEELDIRGMKSLSSVGIGGIVTLKSFRAENSGLTSFVPAEGALLTEVSLPNTLTAMTLRSLSYLESFSIENAGRNLATIKILGCPYLTNDFSFFLNWHDTKVAEDRLCTLELDNVNWTSMTPQQLMHIGQLKVNGGVLKLKGRAVITESSEEIVDQLISIFGGNCFDKSAEFFISAPDAIYISGPGEVLEGFNGQFTAAVFSAYQGKVEWSIVSGGTSYQSIDQYGLLTTRYQGSTRTITIQAKHYPTQGSVVTITKQVSIIKQVRPTGGTISGSTVAGNGSVYTLLVNPSNINTGYSVSWGLSGTAYNDGNVSIAEQDSESCTLAVVGGKTGSFSLVATITNCAGETLTVTKNLELGIMVTVRMLSNQSGDTTLNNLSATYYLNGSSSGLSIKNGVEVSVPIGSPIKVTFPDVSGYAKPNDIEYVLGDENETFTGTYYTTYVYVNIADNQSAYNDTSNATATVSVSGMNATTLKSGEYAKVPTGAQCTVSFSSLDGYKKPDNDVFITEGAKMTRTGTYLTELLTIEVRANEGESLPDSYTITVSGIGTQTTTTGTYKIPYGTTYTVSASAAEGYADIQNQSYTAGVANRLVSVVYLVYKIMDLGNETDLSLMDIFGASTSRNTANCYVVKSVGEYCFPLVYGNAIKNGEANTTAYTKTAGDYSHDFVNHLDNVITDPYIANNEGCTPFKAELSMADTDSIFSNIAVANGGNTLYIRFTVNSIPETGANGVISVLDPIGVVMWSWHIWVWPDDLTPVEITNKTKVNYNILPVNLATKKSATEGKMYNWFYQWGRPTPMLPPKDYNSETNATNYGVKSFTISSLKADTYGVGIQNPQMFYANKPSEYNWFGSVSYYNLWDANCVSTGNSDNTVIKTVYDPCPAGFKIPNGNTFTYFSASNAIGNFNNGWRLKRNAEDTSGVFFPASGSRINASGNIDRIGNYGMYWFSSADSQDYAYIMFLYTGKVEQQYIGRRASGYSVRPVQE